MHVAGGFTGNDDNSLAGQLECPFNNFSNGIHVGIR
jgi:hypothetical protein